MGVCEFCAKCLFADPWMPDREKRKHHLSLADWEESVRAACAICTLLLEHVKNAVQEAERVSDKDEKQPAKTLASTNVDKLALEKARRTKDDHVREATSEELLLEWVETKVAQINAQWPIYEAEIQDAGGSEAWLLKFKPRNTARYGAKILDIPKQNFFVYAAEYDNINAKAPGLENSTQSEMTLDQILQWIRRCEKDHKYCKTINRKRSADEWVPTRLIDVGTKDDHCLHLVETQNKAASQYDKYITLSYKWGYDPSYLLEKGNLQKFLKEIEIEKMPQTFQDAVDVTRRLGVRYLWIDALCLLQKNNEEWLREAPKMQDVYGNSYLSLAAVSADNCQQGLYRKRTSSGASPSIVPVSWSHPHMDCVVIREDFWRGEVLSEPLYTRGWVLQERMLAPRILHFQRRQVLWQCSSLTACEAATGGLSKVVDDERRDELKWRQLFHRPDHSQLTSYDEADMHEIWRLTVASYTSSNLTKSRDKLMAIAGVAKRMQSDFKIRSEDGANTEPRVEDYFAGLWERLFAEQLAWRVVKWRPAVKDRTYRAPSWSWASVDGVVNVPARIRHEREYTMSIEKGGISIQLEKFENKTGTVLFGSLTTEVELYWPLRFSASRMDAMEWDWTGSEGSHHAWCRLFLDKPISYDTHNEDEDIKLIADENGTGGQLECRAAMVAYQRDLQTQTRSMPGFSGFALALRSGKTGLAKTFTRFGLIEFRNLGSESWDELQEVRQSKEQMESEVAPSDDRPTDKHFITIL